MYESYPFPSQKMIDQGWSSERILSHPEYDVREAKILEQCRSCGFTFGVETKTTSYYLRALYKCASLPSDIIDRLKASGFLFSEEGECIGCHIDLYHP